MSPLDTGILPPRQWTWEEVAERLCQEHQGSMVRLPKHLAQHPRDGGMRASIGLPVGQSADFRLALHNRRGLHVQEFSGHYEAHLDSLDSTCTAMVHLQREARRGVATSAVLGGLVGGLLGRSRSAFAIGLLVGAGLGGVLRGEE